MATTNTSLIDVTPLAAQKLDEAIAEQGDAGSLLRVIVTPGGQGGVQYMLGIEKEAAEDDLLIEVDNLRLVIDSESAPLVEGAQIDYMEGLMRSGFVITNPNLPSSGGCACGGHGGGGGEGGCACGGNGGGGGGCACGGGGHGGGGGGGGCACGGH